MFGQEFASPIAKVLLEDGDSGFIAEKIALMTQEVTDNPSFEILMQGALARNEGLTKEQMEDALAEFQQIHENYKKVLEYTSKSNKYLLTWFPRVHAC